jgi:hypothetical protein
MHGKSSLRRLVLTLRAFALGLCLCCLLSGCASFNSDLGSFPDRRGAPPYPDDPEANGNPAKAWYN